MGSNEEQPIDLKWSPS